MDRMQEHTCRGHSQVLHAHSAMREVLTLDGITWSVSTCLFTHVQNVYTWLHTCKCMRIYICVYIDMVHYTHAVHMSRYIRGYVRARARTSIR